MKPYYRVLHKGNAQSHGPIHTRAEAEKHALESARIEPGKSFEVALVLGIASAPAPEASMLWTDGEQPDATDEQPAEELPARPCDVWLKRLPLWIQERAERAMSRPPYGDYLASLMRSFAWSHTPEGHEFWGDVNDHLHLATPLPIAPPDDPEHNPDSLTPEQVGVAEGWRLLRRSEVVIGMPIGSLQFWRGSRREWSGVAAGNSLVCDAFCLRTRLPYGELDKEGKK